MVLSLLRRYLQVYWLKPFDAVNDAANAWALRQFPWEEPILEVGGGDGMFSFIMHDGAFIATDDRYDQADPERSGDIFDVYRRGVSLTVKRAASRSYQAGVDLKWSHLSKCGETSLYRALVLSAPEPLPFRAESFRTVFLYLPHGLVERGTGLDYGRTLKEIRRVLRRDGTLLMTSVNARVGEWFVCHPLRRFFETRGWVGLAEYFKKLDAGRYGEITSLARTSEEWRALLRASGFRVLDGWAQVTPLAWRLYDVQTRPVLRPLIRWSWFLRRVQLKGAVKAVWVYSWLPVLMLFYLVGARPKRMPAGQNGARRVFFAFRAVPAGG